MSDPFGLGPCYVALGKVSRPPTPLAISPQGSRLVHVDLLSSQDDCAVHARILNLGQGLGKGAFVPLQVGDEVIVLFPHGDMNQAVVLGGLGNGAAPNPTANTGTAALLQHPGGVKLSTSDGQPLHGIVHGQFLAEFAPWLLAIEQFLVAISTATTAAQIAGTAASLLGSLGIAPVTGSPLAVNLAASASSGIAPGVGGPPYATALHKASP